MSAVEGVMEVLCGLLEVSIDLSMKTKSGLNDWRDLTLDGSLEFGEMSSKIGGINDGQRRLIWHTDGKKPEMSLKSWVYDKRTSGWVHGGNKLGVFDFFHGKFSLIIPMLIISMLSKKSNGVLSVIWISSWHVHVINEVDKFLLSFWSKDLTSLLFKVLF
jgi:hypothetical protein